MTSRARYNRILSRRLACLKELDTPLEHPTWEATKPYSSILLPGYDEEEYFSRPTKGEENNQEGAAKAEANQENEAKKEESKKEVNRAEDGSLDTPSHL